MAAPIARNPEAHIISLTKLDWLPKLARWGMIGFVTHDVREILGPPAPGFRCCLFLRAAPIISDSPDPARVRFCCIVQLHRSTKFVALRIH